MPQQYNTDLPHVDVLQRRSTMILLQVATPYILHRLLSWLEKEMQHNMALNITLEARTSVLEVIKVVRHTITVLHRCHLAVFYMTGVFYHIAKRVTGINYVSKDYVFKTFLFLCSQRLL